MPSRPKRPSGQYRPAAPLWRRTPESSITSTCATRAPGRLVPISPALYHAQTSRRQAHASASVSGAPAHLGATHDSLGVGREIDGLSLAHLEPRGSFGDSLQQRCRDARLDSDVETWAGELEGLRVAGQRRVGRARCGGLRLTPRWRVRSGHGGWRGRWSSGACWYCAYLTVR